MPMMCFFIFILIQVLVNGPQTPLATSLKPAEIDPHVPEVPLGKLKLTAKVHANQVFFKRIKLFF